MCNPAAFAIVLMAAGTVAQQQGQKKAEKAQRNARLAEEERQRIYEEEKAALQNRSVDDFNSGRTESDIAAAARNIGARLQQAQAAGLAQAAGAVPGINADGVPKIVGNTVAQFRQNAIGNNRNRAAKLGDLNAFGQVMGRKNLRLGDTSLRLGQIGGFQRGSANLLGGELQAAARKGDKLKQIGGYLKMAGQAVAGGAGGAGAGFASGAGTVLQGQGTLPATHLDWETGRYFDVFAEGGRPTVGKVAVVGERGPELFVPDTAGTIIPNHMLRELAAKDAARKAARRDSAAEIEAAARRLFQSLN